MRLRVELLVLALLLLAATAVVLVLLLVEEDGDAVVVALAPAPPFNSSRVKAISWQPRVFVYKGFLSDAECDHLVTLVSVCAAADRIEERITAWTFLPEENAENMQIQRYQHGQRYKPHFDRGSKTWVSPQIKGGPRYATVIMYLSTVEQGGETVFPKAKEWESQPKGDTFSECARKGLAVKAVKGDAVLFFTFHLDGEHDPLSLHESCPVMQGEKWSAPKWIHFRPYENPWFQT